MVFRIFTPDEIEELRRITLWDIIVNSTAVGPNDIQRDVFHWSAGDSCPQPYQLNASKLPPCKYLKGYDYFEVRLVELGKISGLYLRIYRFTSI